MSRCLSHIMEILIKSFKLFTPKFNHVCNIILQGLWVFISKIHIRQLVQWGQLNAGIIWRCVLNLKNATEIQTNKVLASVPIKRIRLSTTESDGRSQGKITEINIVIKQMQQGEITEIYFATAKILPFSIVRFWHRLSVSVKKHLIFQLCYVQFWVSIPTFKLLVLFFA